MTTLPARCLGTSRRAVALAGLAALVVAACVGCSDASTTAQTPDDTVDAGDAQDDAQDAALAQDANDVLDDANAGTCEFVAPPAVDVDAARTKFAMSMFHFNIEYVIGGLDYTDMAGVRHIFAGVDTAAGWDDARVEDWIVTETFAPILQMYYRHPSWGVDIELQGRFVEVLAERHPETLTLLRSMAQRGQVELISFHVNDQLFLAFPREDLDRSIAETKAIFAKHCLPLSGVVFNQEGQAGEGRQQATILRRRILRMAVVRRILKVAGGQPAFHSLFRIRSSIVRHQTARQAAKWQSIGFWIAFWIKFVDSRFSRLSETRPSVPKRAPLSSLKTRLRICSKPFNALKWKPHVPRPAESPRPSFRDLRHEHQ